MRWQWLQKTRNGDDDQVNKDADQGRSEEESKEKYQTEISKKMLKHQIYYNLGEIWKIQGGII